MTKGVFSIRIEGDVWERFQEYYRGRASPMIEDYMREMTSTEVVGNVSREELLDKLKEVEQQKRDREIQERALQMQLKAYDQEAITKKELLESEEAEQKKELFAKLPSELREATSDICQQIIELKITEFLPAYPFRFYYEVLLDDAKKSELYDVAETGNHFQLVADLRKFYRLYEKVRA
jgi:hypothetical protein